MPNGLIDHNGSLERLRNNVIDRLTSGYAHEVLDEQEFEKRVEIANAASTRGDLMELVVDLPETGKDNVPSRGENYMVNEGHVESSLPMINIFSGTTRKGIWSPPRRLESINIFGGTDLDFRKAKLPPDGCQVNAICIFGGADIIVPENVNVRVNGFAFFGGFDNKTDNEEIPGAPTITITGFAFFGGVDIKTKKRK